MFVGISPSLVQDQDAVIAQGIQNLPDLLFANVTICRQDHIEPLCLHAF